MNEHLEDRVLVETPTKYLGGHSGMTKVYTRLDKQTGEVVMIIEQDEDEAASVVLDEATVAALVNSLIGFGVAIAHMPVRTLRSRQ